LAGELEELVDVVQNFGEAAVDRTNSAKMAAGDAVRQDLGEAKRSQRLTFPWAANDVQDRKLPEDRDRCWELCFSIRSFDNVTINTITFFFCVSVLSEDPKKYPSKVQLSARYTPIYTLAKGQSEVPQNPITLYDRKIFVLSYKDLEKHVVKVDMWKVSPWSFNEYFGIKKEKLYDISCKDPNLELMMQRKVSKKQMKNMRKNEQQRVGDVSRFSCRVSLEEIFDFELLCDNWTLEINPAHEDRLRKERKRLTFLMPKDRFSLPGQRQIKGRVASNTVEWNKEMKKWFWARCGSVIFCGTRTHLQNSFFVVIVQTGNPLTVVLDNERLQKISPGARTVGRSLMNLTSVLDISVFKGQVKAFEKERDKYMVGNLSGNVKCILRSKGMKSDELEYREKRPEQPKSSTTVSHLKPNERHLVVKVQKCENLPIADFDEASSDPFLRVSWDNMVMTSAVIYKTIRPVFQQNFYFPVRIVFPQVSKPGNEKKYEHDILMFELESKGSIKMEVWDDDVTSADYLGGCFVTIQDILSMRSFSQRSLVGVVTKNGPEDTLVEKKLQWYEEEKPVRVYGGKTPLHQSNLANNNTAFIHFEAYFFPDWPPDLRLESMTVKDYEENIWEKRAMEWTIANEEFQKHYASPFPDSIGAKKCKEDPLSKGEPLRRFTCLAMHTQRLGDCPLMSFLCPIVIPQEYSTPAKLLHWVYCLSFELYTRQARTGLIPNDGWKDAEFVMARRKGAAQDHAILLCSFLLGQKKDAYVCKGMVYATDASTKSEMRNEEQLIEHAWVMTREDGWVTFWEPCNRQVFHLPRRCQKQKQINRSKTKHKHQPKSPQNAPRDEHDADEEAADPEVTEDDEEAIVPVSYLKGELPDVCIGLDELENLPTVGRQPKPKMRVQAKKKKEEGREALRKALIARRESLDIAPNKEMLRESTVVSWLPYDSIDVVFNDKNLWANRQNHHPACIKYDFPIGEQAEPSADGWKWEPFLKHQDTSDMIIPIAPNVSVQPPLRPNIVDRLRNDLRNEMIQNLLLYRGKKGKDTYFDHGDELMSQLEKFLDIQEIWLQIDPDCPKATQLLETKEEDLTETQRNIRDTVDVRQWNKQGSPFFLDEAERYQQYRADQDRLWGELEHNTRAFCSRIKNAFPTKRGKCFRGFPAHFSTSEHELIRNYLMELDLYKEFIDMASEDIFYSIECRIYPLLGGVLSVWLYIGIQEASKDDGTEVKA